MDTPLLFKFIKMDLSQFAIFVEEYRPEDAEIDLYNRFQFSYNFDEHLVLCKTIIEISNHDTPLLKAELDCIFKIETESASNIEKGDEAIIPSNLLAQFASLAYGSMRGMLYLKTAGTEFGNFILPPSDLSSVFKEGQRFMKRFQST